MATINVYARIHPRSGPSSLVEIQGRRLFASKNARSSQRSSTEIGFTFDSILQANSTQAEVFDKVAKDVVGKFISGYNGTIFAYGQTGTGKTFTVEGEDLSKDVSPKHGIIPKSLSFIFEELENLKDECATVQISFLELYNETAFDLLGPMMYGTNNKRDLPKVLVSLGASGSCSLHGMSLHDVSSEYEARKLHLKGRCNRAVAWTVANDFSSRSHAIFTILLSRQRQDSEVVLKSKLNLVDLAGSESLNNKRRDGTQSLDTDTKHINLSLHYLETVILSLQKLHIQESSGKGKGTKSMKRCQSAHILPSFNKSLNCSTSWNTLKCQSAIGFSDMKRRGHSISISTTPHVSYRNSLLTMILQDSLGGNCNTAMIATLSLDPFNFNETMSTCRFAQRVARVTNNPVINREVNEGILIKKLQNKITKLTKELVALKQGTVDKNDNSITSEEKAKVIDIVHGYLDGRIGDPLERGIDDPQKVRACLAYLKDLVIQNNHKFMSEPNSCDERDSGVGICNSVPTNNSEDEPCSPTLTCSSGNSNDDTLTDTPPNAPSQVVKPHSIEENATCTYPQSSSQHFFAAPSSIAEEAVTSQIDERCVISASSSQSFFSSVTVERPLATNEMSRGSSATGCDYVTMDDTEQKLLLWELELHKQNLIRKSKLFSTALSNQKARILVMEKHGCLMDDIDNERVAEQQLKRKQTKLEQQLAVIVKKIVETKSAKKTSHQESGATRSETVIGDKKGLPQDKPINGTLEIRKLQLQEHSTRLQLLSFREKLVPGILSSFGKCESPDHQPPPDDQEMSTDDGSTNSLDTSTGTYSSPVVSPSPDASPEAFSVMKEFSFGSQIQKPFCDQSKKASKVETPSEIKRVSKSQAQRYPSATSRRGTLTDTKQKSRLSILNNKPVLKRPSKRSIIGPPRTLRPSFGGRHRSVSPSFNRQSTSNISQIKNKRMSSNCNIQQNPSMSSNPDSKEKATKCVMNSVGSRISSVVDNISVPLSLRGVPSSRTRRPALCSTMLLSNSEISKQAARSTAHYDFEPDNGFIFRTNNEVYRTSNFKNDPIALGNTLPNVAHQTTPNSSAGRYTEDVEKSHNSTSGGYSADLQRTLGSSGGYSEDTQDQKSEMSRCNPVSKKFPQTASPQVQASSSTESVDGPTNEASSEAHTNNVPPQAQEAEVHYKISPIGKARRQQIERAKRIREVTKAVQVIQNAYRRYIRRKKM